MYAFQLLAKMSLTFCLCSAASPGRITLLPWMLAAKPVVTDVNATIKEAGERHLMEVLEQIMVDML